MDDPFPHKLMELNLSITFPFSMIRVAAILVRMSSALNKKQKQRFSTSSHKSKASPVMSFKCF